MSGQPTACSPGSAGTKPRPRGAARRLALLGLYNDEGKLQHVGVVGAFTAKRRAELVDELEPLLVGEGDGHPWQEWASADAHQNQRLPGNVSR